MNALGKEKLENFAQPPNYGNTFGPIYAVFDFRGELMHIFVEFFYQIICFAPTSGIFFLLEK